MGQSQTVAALGVSQTAAALGVLVCSWGRTTSMPHYPDEIEYSEKYSDDRYEYRHGVLPTAIAKEMFKTTSTKRLLEEEEWRGLGVTQSSGWVHYEIHPPEPHILLFRRPLGTHPTTGKVLLHIHIPPGDENLDLAGESLEYRIENLKYIDKNLKYSLENLECSVDNLDYSNEKHKDISENQKYCSEHLNIC